MIGVLLALMSSNSIAQDSNAHSDTQWDRFSVSVGGFFATYNSGIVFASQQLGLGVVIDIEDALGLESSQLALRGNVNYAFGKTLKHSASVGYFSIFRNSKKTLESDLDLGGVLFPEGTEIKSSFDLTILRAKYEYLFYKDDRVLLGASFGLFIMPIGLKVNALNSQEKITQFTAPLPLLGVRTDFKISDKIYLKQSVEVLYISFTNFTGSLLDLNIAVEHKTFDHVAFGLGFNSNRFNFKVRNPDSNLDFFGNINLEYTGVLFYGKYYL